MKAGSDDLFASHLATASQEQARPTQQPKETNRQDQKAPRSINNTTSKAAEDSKGPETSNVRDQDTSASVTGQSQESDGATESRATASSSDEAEPHSADKEKQETTEKDSTSDSAPNNSAGAAMLVTPPPVAQANAAQVLAKTQGNESVVSQMLGVISLAADGILGMEKRANPTSSVPQEQTPLPANNEASEPAPAAQAAPPSIVSPTDGKDTLLMADDSVLPAQRTVSFMPTAQPETTETTTDSVLKGQAPSANEQFSLLSKQSSAAISVGANPAPASDLPESSVQQLPNIPQAQAESQQSGNQIVQNDFGQILTIYQPNSAEEQTAAPTENGKAVPAGASGQILDAGGNFIQSHLAAPAAAKSSDKESSNPFQQDTAKENQAKGANATKSAANGLLPADQAAQPASANPSLSTDTQTVLFNHQQASVPSVGNSPTTPATQQLPSGLSVPTGTVVDQLIAHFAVNKQLESGVVNLKLNPQELGELRMEIKITQDTVRAHIVAQSPQTQEMIGLHLPRLREALEQQGLHLQQVEVTLAANDNTARDQFSGNQGQHLNQSMQNRNSQPLFTLDAGEEIEETSHAANNLSVVA